MKRLFLGLIIGFFLGASLTVSAAPSLSEKLKGKILLAVQDSGKTYYVAPDGYRYRITQSTALEIFKRLALGINNKDLSSIPEKNIGIDPESKLQTSSIGSENCESVKPVINDAISGLEQCIAKIKQRDEIISNSYSKESCDKNVEELMNIIKKRNSEIEYASSLANKAASTAQKWRDLYNSSCSVSAYVPEIPIYTPPQVTQTECYSNFDTGVVKCYDGNYPPELQKQLDEIENLQTSTTQIERRKAKAIEDYYKTH